MMRTCRLIALFAAVLLAAGAAMPIAAAEETAAAPVEGVVVYYFHGDVRCATCRKLEAYTKEAIRTGFATQLASGAMSFRAVNVDEAPNKHFLTDFQLTTKAVVVVEYADGKLVRHTNLSKIWQLVRDKELFVDYVQKATRAFIDGA